MTGLDFSDPRFWLDFAQTIVILLLWARKPGSETQQRIGAVEGELKLIREQLKHVPLNDELTELEGSMKSLLERLEGMRDQIAGTRDSVRRIEDFLREHR